MESHPKFEELKEECLLFPDHAEQLLQVYLDLVESKDFEDVHVIQAPLLERCLIEGLHPDNSNRYLVIPSLVSEPWSVAKLDDTFSALSMEQDPRLKDGAASRITFGVVAADSTITYLNLQRSRPRKSGDAMASATGTG
ncbi:tRNA intron endonuclease [Gamsiella multidivaricata]|uniref:tRNA intron endonuclease n=1 Tax=Gamsiella multidivaricata TaxID=101098 RepID=UPI0022208FEB|nr:tRNA intron endonuclease [Gamsiella multidivaricata]KAI7817810.1 tRNA intron endonuclease [Gamsiella multidivaricata]